MRRLTTYTPFSTSIRAMMRRRDLYAGGLMILFGLVWATTGPSHGLGTLVHMEAGFMPTVLGVILVLLGVAIALTGVTGADPDGESILPEHPEWLGWLCVLAGPALFILCGTYLGLAPATFCCVLVSALGDRTTTWKSALVLAFLVTLFGVGLFSYVLQVPMPVFEWSGL